MGAILLGATLGFLVGLLAALFILFISDANYWPDWITKVAQAAAVLILTALGGLIGWHIATEGSRQYVHQYAVYKQTIEASLEAENLTGFERAELVRQAAEANKELAGYQYKIQQWYGFTIDERVLELEFIDLSGEE